jgi:hypothetical protein
MKTIGTFAAATIAVFLALSPAWGGTYHVYGPRINGIIIHHCNYPGPIIHGIIIHKCRPLRGIIVTHPRKK